MDRDAEQSPSVEFTSYLDDRLNKGEWGEQQYLKSHLRGIALRVHEQLERGAMLEPDAYVNYRSARPDEEAQRYEQRRREQELIYGREWGETLCAGCGQRLRTWADSERKRCGYCHHVLPPEE